MIKKVCLCGMIAVSLAVTACQGKKDSQTDKAVQKKSENVASYASLAQKFLRGAQATDKKMMYEAAGLTTATVDGCREKLIHPTQYKQSADQRKSCENVLRISGEVDYFIGKIVKIFPKTSSFQVTKTESSADPSGIQRFDHTITITYNTMAEAITDKTGKLVKSMVVHLLQTSGSFEGQVIHSFSFDSKGFDRFVDKDFQVVSYF